MGSIACDNPSPAVCFTERRYQNRNLQLPRPPQSHPAPGRARAKSESQMKRNSLEIGDRVKLFPESLGWKGEFRLRDKIGEATEIRDDGRITVRFQNGRLLMGRDAEGFERFEPGLKAKGI